MGQVLGYLCNYNSLFTSFSFLQVFILAHVFPSPFSPRSICTTRNATHTLPVPVFETYKSQIVVQALPIITIHFLSPSFSKTDKGQVRFQAICVITIHYSLHLCFFKFSFRSSFPPRFYVPPTMLHTYCRALQPFFAEIVVCNSVQRMQMPFVPRSLYGRQMPREDGGPNKDFLTYLFCDQGFATQFLKDVGLLRSKVHQNTCGRHMT